MAQKLVDTGKGAVKMTKAAAQWASHHDWYVTSYPISENGSDYAVRVREILENGKRVEYTFQDLKELRCWAGY